MVSVLYSTLQYPINRFFSTAFAPAARAAALQGKGGIIHFEILPKNVNKVVDAQIPVLGDVVTNLVSLVPLIKSSPRTQWFNDLKSWKEAYPFTYSKESTMVKPQAVIEELDRLTADRKEDVIITTGVGQHQMWAAQHFRWRYPRTMITSGGLGTMGFGLPGAIGAKIAAPEKIVVDVDGDASFSMTAMELQTASQYGIGVKVLILNNDYQGMVVQWQGAFSLSLSSSPSIDAAYTDLFYDARYSHTVNKNPDFVKLAEAMNVKALRLTNPADLPAKMKEFLEYDNTKPIVMECLIEQNEHVFPMVCPLFFLSRTINLRVPLRRFLPEKPSMRASYTQNCARNRKQMWRLPLPHEGDLVHKITPSLTYPRTRLRVILLI